MIDETHEEQTQQQAQPEQEPASPLGKFIFHQRRAAKEAAEAVRSILPPEFYEHSAKAREEFLTSFRALIDGAAKVVDREAKRAKEQSEASRAARGRSTTGKTKVKVEVS